MKIEQCIFCECEYISCERAKSPNALWFVFCECCKTSGPLYLSEDEAIEDWNRISKIVQNNKKKIETNKACCWCQKKTLIKDMRKERCVINLCLEGCNNAHNAPWGCDTYYCQKCYDMIFNELDKEEIVIREY